mmetsp:Transcript_7769/g.7238  ORF Transcript_7769/g.7238 Transcript_7769/m.7238 type:complete len:109 (-) Transcript_7769:822-1148(-)
MLFIIFSISAVITNFPSNVLISTPNVDLIVSIRTLNLASSCKRTEFIESSYLKGYFFSTSFILNGSLIEYKISKAIFDTISLSDPIPLPPVVCKVSKFLVIPIYSLME